MVRKRWFGSIVLCSLLLPTIVFAGPTGRITLKDGSQVIGEIVEMTEGIMKVKTLFHEGDPIKIKWSEVNGIDSEETMSLVLKNGIVLQGKPSMKEPGTLNMKTDLLTEPIPVAVESVIEVNPPLKRVVKIDGNLSFGGNITTGNTDLKNFAFVGNLVARSKRLRLTLLGRYLYAENNGDLDARNAFGNIKLDFFITKRFYTYLGALFEQDTFQDLNLRTSFFTGPGYQFIDEGDYSNPYLAKMQFDGEIGLGYFNEDFKRAEDNSYFTGRWGINFNWPVLPWLTIFHWHQGFPSFDKSKDWYITSQQGIRLKVWEDLISTFQVNWRYDNDPAPDTKKADTQYLFTIGFQFES